MHRLLRLAPLLVTPVLASCWAPAGGGGGGGSGSSSGTSPTPATDPPLVQDVSMTQTAVVDGTQYVISGSISYSDDNDVVTVVEVQVPVLGKTYKFPVSDPVSSAVGEPFTFTLSTDPPLGGAGNTDYDVILVNKSGAASQPVPETVYLP